MAGRGGPPLAAGSSVAPHKNHLCITRGLLFRSFFVKKPSKETIQPARESRAGSERGLWNPIHFLVSRIGVCTNDFRV